MITYVPYKYVYCVLGIQIEPQNEILNIFITEPENLLKKLPQSIRYRSIRSRLQRTTP